ncbi:MAG: sigma-70 family RNA polymerase sigma factor [Planctomycetes bacterium]|nr:sigma-70 family RNA polymerase sigma factor [Planctomycetota bacterium]
MPDVLPPHRDPARFDDLVLEVGPESLLVMISRQMGPAARALCEPEDVWQETLAAAWRDRAQHEWTGLPVYRAWLVAIARNRIQDVVRAAGAAKRGGGAGAARFTDLRGPGSGSLSDALPAGSVTPSRVAHHNERARIMVAALESLPADVEPIVRMHLFEERTMEDISADLGLGVSAAWHRFRKGVALYRDALKSLMTRGSDSGGP